MSPQRRQRGGRVEKAREHTPGTEFNTGETVQEILIRGGVVFEPRFLDLPSMDSYVISRVIRFWDAEKLSVSFMPLMTHAWEQWEHTVSSVNQDGSPGMQMSHINVILNRLRLYGEADVLVPIEVLGKLYDIMKLPSRIPFQRASSPLKPFLDIGFMFFAESCNFMIAVRVLNFVRLLSYHQAIMILLVTDTINFQLAFESMTRCRILAELTDSQEPAGHCTRICQRDCRLLVVLSAAFEHFREFQVADGVGMDGKTRKFTKDLREFLLECNTILRQLPDCIRVNMEGNSRVGAVRDLLTVLDNTAYEVMTQDFRTDFLLRIIVAMNNVTHLAAEIYRFMNLTQCMMVINRVGAMQEYIAYTDKSEFALCFFLSGNSVHDMQVRTLDNATRSGPSLIGTTVGGLFHSLTESMGFLLHKSFLIVKDSYTRYFCMNNNLTHFIEFNVPFTALGFMNGAPTDFDNPFNVTIGNVTGYQIRLAELRNHGLLIVNDLDGTVGPCVIQIEVRPSSTPVRERFLARYLGADLGGHRTEGWPDGKPESRQRFIEWWHPIDGQEHFQEMDVGQLTSTRDKLLTMIGLQPDTVYMRESYSVFTLPYSASGSQAQLLLLSGNNRLYADLSKTANANEYLRRILEIFNLLIDHLNTDPTTYIYQFTHSDSENESNSGNGSGRSRQSGGFNPQVASSGGKKVGRKAGRPNQK